MEAVIQGPQSGDEVRHYQEADSSVDFNYNYNYNYNDCNLIIHYETDESFKLPV
jgi:hypothetical protein